jgi:circadian clock protein KaiC
MDVFVDFPPQANSFNSEESFWVHSLVPLNKSITGIEGLDELTGGGLPAGRATLVCGGPGCGKTLFATAFLVNGALRAGEPGVFMSFDERAADLEADGKSLGFDLPALQRDNLLAIDYVHVDRQEIYETGQYDLEGLFIRIGHAAERVKARRVVLDSIDTLFAGVPSEAILRAELRRLFIWLKDRGLSVIITAERGETTLTRHGIEEYVSDCVLVLEQRVENEIATRRLRVVKYRGSGHGTNEYPFLIQSTGIFILPVTSLGLAHAVSEQRISSGIAGIDDMLEGKGFYKGSSILITGGPGSGKTVIGAHFARAGVQAGRRCLYFLFEESQPQLVRNMRTVGIDFEPALLSGLLRFESVRPTTLGLELHLATMMRDVRAFRPDFVIIDPLSALQASGSRDQSTLMVLRLVDFLKSLGVTTLYLAVQGDKDQTELNVSSLMDTWLSVQNRRQDNELERSLYVIKSRGMAHSSDVRRLALDSGGAHVTGRGELNDAK